MGVKGLNWPVLFFFYLSLSLRKSLLIPPKHAVMKILEIKAPQILTCI